MAPANPGDNSRSLEPGTLINNRYRIERAIGSGGMGSVYLAKDEVIGGEPVAVKVLHTDLIGDERQMQRFMREVQLMRRVNQRNVVRTFDVGSDRELVYFTMEFVPGRPLEDFVEDQSFPLAQIPTLIVQICEGLEAIHKAGVIHRDLKPANIIVLEDGTAKITDFGVARPEFSDLTAHNEIVGSALYISPEVWLGTRMTPSVDLYSLGVMLFELTTGLLPFEGDTPAALMRMHLEHQPDEPKRLNRKIAPWLNKLILRLLAKSELDRPRDAREVIETVKLNTDWGGKGDSRRLQGLETARREAEERRKAAAGAATGENSGGGVKAVELSDAEVVDSAKRAAMKQMRYTTAFVTPTSLSGEVVIRLVLGAVVAFGTLGVGEAISWVLSTVRSVQFESNPDALSAALLQVDGSFPELFTTLAFIFVGFLGAVLRCSFPLVFIGAMAGVTPFIWRFFTRAIGAGSLAACLLLVPFLIKIAAADHFTPYSLYSAALAIQQQLTQVATLDPEVTKYVSLATSQGITAVPESLSKTVISGFATLPYLLYLGLTVLFVRRTISRRFEKPGIYALGIVLGVHVLASLVSFVLGSADSDHPLYRHVIGEGAISLSVLFNNFVPVVLQWATIFLLVFFVTLLKPQYPDRDVK